MGNGIVLIGLGPGDPSLLTLQAREILVDLDEIVVKTKMHLVVDTLPEKTRIISFDHILTDPDRVVDAAEEIVETILEQGRRPDGVTYAVPGSPLQDDAGCREIVRKAKEEGMVVRVIEGISLVESACSTLGIDVGSRLVVEDAADMIHLHHPNFPPTFPAMITNMNSGIITGKVKQVLLSIYPVDDTVSMVRFLGERYPEIEHVMLHEIDSIIKQTYSSILYVPPLEPDSSFEAFQEVVAHLRAPEGCPWDREQTHSSLRKSLLEETYEALHAIDQGDPRKLAEELGDLLLQIVLHAQIGFEAGNFSMVEVLHGINRKIVYRHPHVFGDLKLKGMDHLLTNWEKLKAAERKENGDAEKSLLEGVPEILPALTQAQEVQDRAARVGFDWKDIRGVMDKIIEEVREIDEARDPQELADEMGDLLFAVVNYARWRKVDPEFALRDTTLRFRRRFGYIEEVARSQGKDVAQLSFDELNDAWDEAKSNE